MREVAQRVLVVVRQRPVAVAVVLHQACELLVVQLGHALLWAHVVVLHVKRWELKKTITN